MKPHFSAIGLAILAWHFAARPACALVAMIDLADLARARVRTLSFFLLVFLLCAFAVQRIWNGLRSDFPRLPRLSYVKALGVVTLWGLLFLIVLTMVSGARELFNPDAANKEGLTARSSEVPPNPAQALETERRTKLASLRQTLWDYAAKHAGKFPPNAETLEIPPHVWEIPDLSGMRYLYVPGRRADDDSLLLAYEPGLFRNDRMALFTDGSIKSISLNAIRSALDPRRAK